MLFGCAALLTGSAALALGIGDNAPNFALAANTGEKINLANFAGKRHVVLFFYIGAFTNT
jgi:peroxiredoxin Q/BCP